MPDKIGRFKEALGADVAIPVASPEEALTLYERRRLAINHGLACNVCGEPATVVDTEYNEYFCDEDADTFLILDGPHRPIAMDDEPHHGD